MKRNRMKNAFAGLLMSTALITAGAAAAGAAEEARIHVMETAPSQHYYHPTHGYVLTDPWGMTLYTYAEDPDGQSTCVGDCADFWRPVHASSTSEAAGNLTIIDREDGTRQWAYGNRPLYRWTGDTYPGDIYDKDQVWLPVVVGTRAHVIGDRPNYTEAEIIADLEQRGYAQISDVTYNDLDERYTMSAITAKGEPVDLWVDAMSGEIVLRDLEHSRGS